ncbi:MAG: bifunctional phosphoribosylaminoimidazolecarboxamide formyltransferase/IMP cyclohydrolase [Clostridiaceae bacterium]|jgi:phosphoribosylaminoimidazolecarboxamide formyltransferase/IMP cyclohydrolase|nr:bifunctional phosphoribosylaminoimidazolecarboxamide formyltransferase/IMP cyclohydrolase [Clostridiaceae bacterium]
MKKRALISVSDKTGVVEFARGLIDLNYEIISTGGTALALQKAGIEVIGVSDITGFPECLDGRVKTLHPKIHAGILAVRNNAEHMQQLAELDVNTIDVVAINLYPFKQTILKEGVAFNEAIENIDIGGPTMIRAAAKNYQDVAVVVDPNDYPLLINHLKANTLTIDIKKQFAFKVFEHTAAYDALIANYLAEKLGQNKLRDTLTLTFEKVADMRYGENPHQGAAFYKEIGKFEGSLTAATQLHGKELSYNNIADTDAAIAIVKEFDEPCVVAVKHANPCGVATGKDIYNAYNSAYNADPVSIFGGIVAANREIDKATAEQISKIFLEIVIAPSFSKEAIEIISQKKNIRILELPGISVKNTEDMMDFKKVSGGLLIQGLDCKLLGEQFKTVTKIKPTEKEIEDLLFAWKIAKYTKSNAIVLAKDSATVGIGPGQTNRITALELAIKYAGEKSNQSVMASDAYFPFPDCVEAAAKTGITAIIQPGGSIRDEESIKKCDELGISMVFTGLRHFKH